MRILSISAAAKEHGIHRHTLTAWLDADHVQSVHKADNLKLYDAAAVARTVKHHANRPGPGRPKGSKNKVKKLASTP